MLFLLIGLLLSAFSKTLQYINKVKIGNMLVVPAAICLILALIFSLPKIKLALQKVGGLQSVVHFSIWVCIGLLSFQFMLMILFTSGNKLALLLLIPLVLSRYMSLQKWNLI